jgi:hypothetical protein
MLARLRKLEQSRTAGDQIHEWINDSFGAAIAEGRMCPVDGPVVLRCLLNWIGDRSMLSHPTVEGWAPLK